MQVQFWQIVFMNHNMRFGFSFNETNYLPSPDWSEPETVWPWSSDSHNERVSSSLGSHWSEAGVLAPDWSIVRVSHAHMCDEGITVSCLWSVSRQFIRYRHNYNQRRARGNAPNGLSEAEHRLDLRHVICLTFLNPIIQSLKHSANLPPFVDWCQIVQVFNKSNDMKIYRKITETRVKV